MKYFVSLNEIRLEVNADGIPLSPPSYWGAEMFETIAALPRHEEPNPETPAPQPDWAGFLEPFSTPTAGGIYHSILSNLKLSTMETIDHWTNIKMGLTNAEIRSPQWLVPSWNGLKLMLAADGNPLSEETIAEAEALMAQYHLLP